MKPNVHKHWTFHFNDERDLRADFFLRLYGSDTLRFTTTAELLPRTRWPEDKSLFYDFTKRFGYTLTRPTISYVPSVRVCLRGTGGMHLQLRKHHFSSNCCVVAVAANFGRSPLLHSVGKMRERHFRRPVGETGVEHCKDSGSLSECISFMPHHTLSWEIGAGGHRDGSFFWGYAWDGGHSTSDGFFHPARVAEMCH